MRPHPGTWMTVEEIRRALYYRGSKKTLRKTLSQLHEDKKLARKENPGERWVYYCWTVR